jgi:predicted dehydrogenase
MHGSAESFTARGPQTSDWGRHPALRSAQIQVGLLGLGSWGCNLARVFSAASGCRLRIACDVDPRRVTAAAAQGNAEKYTTDPLCVLEDGSLDAVVVATPPRTHAELVMLALAARKHVFVEKPLALSLSDALRIEDAAARASRRVMVGHILLHHPAIIELVSMIRAGELGRLRVVASERLAPPRSPRVESPWWTLAPHDLSVLDLLLEREFTRGTIVLRGSVEQAQSSRTAARLKFPAGVVGRIEVSAVHPRKQRCLTIVGEDCTAVFDDVVDPRVIRVYGNASWALHGTDADPVRVRLVPAVEPLALEAQHFIDALVNREPFRTDLSSGVRVVRALEAGMLSLRRGSSPVAIDGNEPNPSGTDRAYS